MALPKLTFLLPCLLGAAGLFVARQSGDGSAGFYAATVLTAIVYATTWWFMGSRNAFAGPGKAADIARGVAIGAALATIFVAGAVIVSRIPPLAEPVGQLLATTEKGGLAPTLLVLILNGIGEELVYRDAVPRQLRVHGLLHHTTSISAVSLALYCLVTAAMGVWLLILAAAVIGAVAHYEAFRGGRLYSSISLHLTWSTGMLFLLPLFFR
ncbi:CPBP family glutamic-type intramembrane protease [Corynebacterium sanguinis]|nr:CPBP family glutamic-type intramembrane protease [Corynebacterium sanguinis]MCT1414728.1 CPBP family glutamic-type intramembrane protease [Corynebacterium sanguinis]MCT1463770.1 CPBP family glutamic-type intramembrane protease [Corynebacterium sanguinis]MCT1498991.1 CPBP family glutamic-type intramembrane protease [Corynebacterium sanguinis]MCT1555195.1 CPBP family glutamic-type intramembrane protease [Corynebacterium sanguinis]MCT2022250.1 CPBP family glutamic-type intramembrane protease [